MSEHEILVQHMVDIHEATAEFREASERKRAASSHMNSSRKTLLRPVRLRKVDLASTTGTLVPVGKKEDAFEKHCRKVASRTLQRCFRIC